MLVSVIALMFTACKKENQNKMLQNSENEVYWTQEDVEIQNRILAFQDKIKNNSFKNGEQMPLDDAIWNLEALINYNYSNPDSSFVNLSVDTTFEFSLPVNNGMVNYEYIADAAFEMEAHIVDFLEQMPNAIKFIIATDVRIKDDGFKNGTKTLTITTGYGSEYIDNPNAYIPFGANDYWYYGQGYNNLGGYCDGPLQGQSTDSDAAEEIEYKINNPDPAGSMNIYPPGTVYYTNVVTVAEYYYEFGNPDYTYNIYDYPNPNDDQANDGWLDYLTLQVNWAGHCLCPEEMNFYLQGNLDIIEAERQKLITITGIDYAFMYTDVFGMSLLGDGKTFFSGMTTYGERHFRIPIE